MYKRYLKTILDFSIALSALCLLSPFLVGVSIVLYFANKKSGVFFTQARTGENAAIFHVIKFKTMTDERDAEGNLAPDDVRLTKMGKWIRSLSIDELPQLINIVKGEMSLIGPRPLLPKYLPLYSEEQFRRFDARPGLTGWAQIHGRNAISWQKKFEYDVWYVDHLSFALDAKIFFLTIKKVCMREGISKEGMATTVPFDGTN